MDVAIVVAYFVAVFLMGIYKRVSTETNMSEYFMHSNSLRWPSIALSTIATNIHSGHFLGMTGSAYLFGLAQANFEVNALQGILFAAFIFVPIYLKERILTIGQFFERVLGPKVAVSYSLFLILMNAFVFVGSVLFWGGYAVNAVFPEAIAFISPDPMIRIFVVAIALGLFSATYTYLGGMGAVVRTDMIQFVLLLVGGLFLTFMCINAIGGWGVLWEERSDVMHLHLPANHPTLPWPAIAGMMLINFYYWGSNQVIVQRALAAKNLHHAQVGLIAGGFLKYFMALIIIVPGIALSILMESDPLTDPDLAYPTLILQFIPTGLRGIILCGLFASLMSSVDSLFHSTSTLFSVDIYKRHLRPDASDQQVVKVGRYFIWAIFLAGVIFAWVNVYVKFDNPGFALTHWFNEMTFYVQNGIAFLIIVAIFLVAPSKRLVFWTLIGSVLCTFFMKIGFPEMNYLNRTSIVILTTVLVVATHTIIKQGRPKNWGQLINISSPGVGWLGLVLLVSLLASHVVFH